MEDFSAYTLMLDVGWISLLMVIGNILRHQVKFIFQDLLLPAPITAGLIGLLVGPNVLGWINFSDNLGDYTSILIAVVFASMAYSMEVGGNMGKGARNMWGYSTMMFTGQWGLFIVLGLFLFAPLFDTPNWFGMMLPVGFTGGFGTAAAVGGDDFRAEMAGHPGRRHRAGGDRRHRSRRHQCQCELEALRRARRPRRSHCPGGGSRRRGGSSPARPRRARSRRRDR